MKYFLLALLVLLALCINCNTQPNSLMEDLESPFTQIIKNRIKLKSRGEAVYSYGKYFYYNYYMHYKYSDSVIEVFEEDSISDDRLRSLALFQMWHSHLQGKELSLQGALKISSSSDWGLKSCIFFNSCIAVENYLNVSNGDTILIRLPVSKKDNNFSTYSFGCPTEDERLRDLMFVNFKALVTNKFVSLPEHNNDLFFSLLIDILETDRENTYYFMLDKIEVGKTIIFDLDSYGKPLEKIENGH
jgi:hypothetical protein